MNLSQLKDSIAFIKELLETNSVEEILKKLDNSFSLNIKFSINQDFGIDLTNSDEEWYTVKPFVQSPSKWPRSVQFWEEDWTKGI